MKTTINLVMMATAVSLIVGCATGTYIRPNEERNSAYRAIKEAEQAGAPELAKEEYAAAVDMYQQANDAFDKDRLKEACVKYYRTEELAKAAANAALKGGKESDAKASAKLQQAASSDSETESEEATVATTPEPTTSGSDTIGATAELEPGISQETLTTQTTTEASTQKLEAIVFDKIFFEFDRYDLTPNTKTILEKNAEGLNANATTNVLVEGHCDERGSNEYNLILGQKRAAAVREFLAEKGVDGNRLQTISYGEEKPVSLGHTQAEWSQNRRAEFKIVE